MTACALLFPGQASQVVGMARDLYEEHGAVREIFDRAEGILDLPLTRLCFDGPEEDLSQTAATQPAVFVHSVAAWDRLAATGLEPTCVAGHSLGEYSALVAAGALEFEEALRLVGRRSRLMQEAGDERAGAMAALIGLDDARVEELCEQAAAIGVVVPANYNAPGQVVVSGEVAAVERLEELAGDAGARRVVRLAVSGAFHSPLMRAAAQEMAAVLERADLRAPRVPVITNVGAAPVRDARELRQHLIDQITHPVRWVESMQQLPDLGVQAALEVGPGAVLRGLLRRIVPGLDMFGAGTNEDIDAAIAALSA